MVAINPDRLRELQAEIIARGNRHHPGCFDTPEEAHAAYAAAAGKHFGEFARTA